MGYTHKVLAPSGQWWWLCYLHDGYLHYKTDYGKCACFETGHLSVEEFYREADGYTVTKIKQFTGNT